MTYCEMRNLSESSHCTNEAIAYVIGTVKRNVEGGEDEKRPAVFTACQRHAKQNAGLGAAPSILIKSGKFLYLGGLSEKHGRTDNEIRRAFGRPELSEVN